MTRKTATLATGSSLHRLCRTKRLLGGFIFFHPSQVVVNFARLLMMSSSQTQWIKNDVTTTTTTTTTTQQMVAILSPFHNHPPVDGPEYICGFIMFHSLPKTLSILVGGAITILKNMSSSMGLGWHPIYEMENKTCLKPTTSISRGSFKYERWKRWNYAKTALRCLWLRLLHMQSSSDNHTAKSGRNEAHEAAEETQAAHQIFELLAKKRKA